jgi:cytidylate kinase
MYFQITPKIDSNFAFQLYKYEKELKSSESSNDAIKPIITISREFGCESHALANVLARRLSTEKIHWVAFSKQTLSQDASAATIRHRILEEMRMMKRNALEQMIDHFLSNKPTNYQMFRDLVDEMKILGERGHAILIGAGGSLLMKDHPQAIHIRLIGSLQFRQYRIARDYHLSDAEAMEMVVRGQKTRDQFIHDFLHQDISDPHIYDLTLRNDKYSVDQMADIVIQAYRARFGNA